MKFTLTAIPVIIAYIRTKFGTVSKSDVSVTGLPLVFTSWKMQHGGTPASVILKIGSAVHCSDVSAIGLTVSTIGQTFRHAT